MVQDRFKFAGRAIFFYVGTLTKSLLTIREKPGCLFLLVEGCRWDSCAYVDWSVMKRLLKQLFVER